MNDKAKKSVLAARWSWHWAHGLAMLCLLLLGWIAAPVHAAIVLEGSGSGSNVALPEDGSPGALTINRPAAARPGMALIVSIAARPHDMTWVEPAGWTQLSVAAEQENGGTSTAPGGMTMRTYYKIVGVGEPNSYTWTFANSYNQGGSAVGGMLVFSGLDTSSSPLDAVPTSRLMSSSTNTFRTNAVTTATSNAVVVSMISYLSSGTFGQPTCNPTVSPAPVITEVLDVAAPPPNDAVGTTLQMAYFTQATAGPSCAPQSVVNANNDTGLGHLMALRPSTRDLTLALTRNGPLTPGGAASYTMTVTNAGSSLEPGPLTIVNTLPAGLTYVSSGPGWSCDPPAGQTVNCRRNGTLAAGAAAPPLVINVNVAGGTSGVVTYTATVSGTGGDGNTGNNTDTDSYVIPTTPYAEYRLDEASWGTILDASGNGRHAEKLGTAAPKFPVPSPPGPALTGSPGTCGAGDIPSGTGTNGINTKIDVNNLGNAGTIAFWYVSKEAWQGNHRMLFDASNNLGNDNQDKHFFLVKTSNGQLRFALEDTADLDSTATSPSYNFAANTWHHVAVAWDLAADRLYIYLDGNTAPVATSTTNVNGTLGDMATLYFGAQRMTNVGGTPTGYTTNTANAYIDEIRLYNSALAPEEIADIYTRRHSCGGVSIATPSAITEGNSGTSTLNFTVSLDSVKSSAVSVNFATSNGTATGGSNCSAGVDYITTSGTLTIPANTLTGTIPVTICGDTVFEDNETFTVTLSNPSGVTLDSPSTATGTINNDDATPMLTVSDAMTAEGNSGTKILSFPVTLGAVSGMSTTVNYTLANGSATGGPTCGGATDFRNAGGTVTIPAGSTTATIDVPICGDTTYENDETFTVSLSDPVNAALGAQATATGTIVNDDIDPSGCFEDSFAGTNGSAPSGNWTTTTSSGTFGTPKIYGERLRLTDASTNVSTAAHLQKMFPGAGNKIIVEFDLFAYNGTGADGIALTFSDASVTPQAGAFGGSLGYAQKSGDSDCGVPGGCPGFAGGWLGIGFDEHGNFSNETEGRVGGDGAQSDNVAIRGSGSGQSGYRYHTRAAVSGIDQPGTTAGPGHRYRITVDHTDNEHAYVTVERCTSSTNCPPYPNQTNYSIIIPQYDAKAKSGQAAVPANWLLSYTGSTGASTNIHEVDQLRVCAVKPIIPIGPNHYRISHGGTALTCEAEPVTITAHDASHGRAGAGGRTLSISTSSSKGSWRMAADGCTGTCYNMTGSAVTCGGTFTPTTGNNGQASYLFANGESGITLCLKHNEAATVNINVSDGSVSEASGAASGETPSADPSLVFGNTGFRFYADGNADGIGNLIAGLRSDTIDGALQPAPQAITIRALKSTETTPQRCIPLLKSGTRAIQFAYQCVDPNACHVSSGGLEVNGTAVAGSAGEPTPASNVNVPFDVNGIGTINLKYWDVGQIKLYAQAAIPDAVTGGGVSIVTGKSNGFIVKPYGFTVAACTGGASCTTANTSAIDGTGSVFAKAGDAFKATISAVAYGGTVVTPSFGLGAGKDTETVTLSTTLVAPTGGAEGTLGGTIAPKRDAFTNGILTLTDLNWSEVGVMKLKAENSLFQTVASTAAGTSGNIGRFTPHHFGVTGTLVTRSDQQDAEPFPPTTGTIAAESKQLTVASVAGMTVGSRIRISGAGTAGANLLAKIDNIAGLTLTLNVPAKTGVVNAAVDSGGFTYMGEPMRLTLAVTAYNKAEGETQNYKGGFAKLDAGTLGTTIGNWTDISGGQRMGLAAVNGATNLTARLGITGAAPANTTAAGGGVAGWSGGMSFFTLDLVFSRGAAPDGPYHILKIGAKPLDADGVTLPPRMSTDTAHCVNLDVSNGNENAACNPGADESNLRRKLFDTDVRFGRLHLYNAYGSELLPPRVEYRAEFWNGSRWAINADDSLTAIAPGNIAIATAGLVLNNVGALANGVGFLNFATAAAGSYDIAVNLGGTANDASCNKDHPATTAANMPWLRGSWGAPASCDDVGAWAQDPSARIRLGSPKAPYIYMRERY